MAFSALGNRDTGRNAAASPRRLVPDRLAQACDSVPRQAAERATNHGVFAICRGQRAGHLASLAAAKQWLDREAGNTVASEAPDPFLAAAMWPNLRSTMLLAIVMRLHLSAEKRAENASLGLFRTRWMSLIDFVLRVEIAAIANFLGSKNCGLPKRAINRRRPHGRSRGGFLIRTRAWPGPGRVNFRAFTR
jgi:hypothetical protein